MTDLVNSFEKYAEKVKTLKTKPDDNDLLKLYGLYKQSQFGDNKSTKPWVFQIEASAKYNAWLQYKGLSTNDAMNKYISFAKILLLREKKID